MSFGVGVVSFKNLNFWNSANRELFMKPSLYAPEIFECTQVWNCGTLAQFEATMANAAENLAHCLSSRGPSPKNLVSYTAQPARVYPMGEHTENQDVIKQLTWEKISSTLTLPITTTNDDELGSRYITRELALLLLDGLIKCYVNHKNIRAKGSRELLFLRKQDWMLREN